MTDTFDDHNSLDNSEHLEALGDHLILELVDERDERTPSGLVIPKSAQQKQVGYHRFVVLACGPLCSDDRISEFPEPSVEPGDIILAPLEELGVYSEAGQNYYIATYDSVAAIIHQHERH